MINIYKTKYKYHYLSWALHHHIRSNANCGKMKDTEKSK